jgi:hypothetical protein
MSGQGKKVEVRVKPQRWYLGGFAGCMAVCFTHPLDLVKVFFLSPGLELIR